MAARLAQRERESMLGRLAATVAHEVRNPLGGMSTALDTVRKFGDDLAARAKALDLIERGLWSIGNVVNSVLAFHRMPSDSRKLTRGDLDDLRIAALECPTATIRRSSVGICQRQPSARVEVRPTVSHCQENASSCSLGCGNLPAHAVYGQPEQMSLLVDPTATTTCGRSAAIGPVRSVRRCGRGRPSSLVGGQGARLLPAVVPRR